MPSFVVSAKTSLGMSLPARVRGIRHYLMEERKHSAGFVKIHDLMKARDFFFILAAQQLWLVHPNWFGGEPRLGNLEIPANTTHQHERR